MKIKFVKNTISWGYAYMTGEEADVKEAFAAEMVESGFAVIVNKAPTELPVDLPGRKVLIENGITTMDELRKIKDPEILMELKGIGKKVAEQIIAFVK